MNALEYLLSLEKFGIKFGLENIRTLCAALGDPQTAYASVLIAGTNGKGSVTAMVDCSLRAAGLRVGRYTSPHLIHLEERFAIDGQPVGATTLAGVIEETREIIETLLANGALDAPPTFFEATTAIAFELFRRAGVQWAVLEVGLGGRLDSTNCVEPAAAAITSIAFDHQQYLGDTLAAIAAEKAGVIRPGIPVIIGPLEAEARGVIVSMCEAAGARLVDAHDGVEVESRTAEGRTSIKLTTARAEYGWIPLGLRGAHQIPNALVAARLVEELARDIPIGPRAVAAGLRDVRWPGRLQLLETPGGKRVLLDAAHNPAGAAALAAYVTREFPEPIPFVFGAMRDKDAAEMLRILLPVASAFVLTEPANNRARPAGELASLVASLAPERRIDVEPKPIAALERAWASRPVVCAAGSIFLIGELLEGLGAGVTNL
ncbi:MAG TPA: folylpolyglutamate synthase/dihydrofolate synthase family protein [Vicinamibacterales bacterium]|nr:folylpolyglutamate synthase/dihydrofolate synthase family protein [Vicinamibacterales bacterium]